MWIDTDAEAAGRMAPIVGARPEEVAVMQTLTANLHFLMAAFYRPDANGRHKIILESKAFPSDHVRAAIVPSLPRIPQTRYPSSLPHTFHLFLLTPARLLPTMTNLVTCP